MGDNNAQHDEHATDERVQGREQPTGEELHADVQHKRGANLRSGGAPLQPVPGDLLRRGLHVCVPNANGGAQGEDQSPQDVLGVRHRPLRTLRRPRRPPQVRGPHPLPERYRQFHVGAQLHGAPR